MPTQLSPIVPAAGRFSAPRRRPPQVLILAEHQCDIATMLQYTADDVERDAYIYALLVAVTEWSRDREGAAPSELRQLRIPELRATIAGSRGRDARVKPHLLEVPATLPA